MDKLGFIEIRIEGSKGNLSLTPDNYDISELIIILQNAEHLLYPIDKKDRQVISYQIEQGSVRHIFKTSMQQIISFNAVLENVLRLNSIDFLDSGTAKAFENIQEIAIKKNYDFLIKTSLSHSSQVEIKPSTRYFRAESIWADAEFYFYGRITNAGGKDKANIHIATEEYGTLRIQTPIRFLEAHEENILYKTYGIRAVGKQQIETGEIDTSTLKFVELVSFDVKYDKEYLQGLRDKAKRSWIGGLDADEWLREIRGSYDA